MGGARSEGQGGPQARARKRALSLTAVSAPACSNRSTKAILALDRQHGIYRDRSLAAEQGRAQLKHQEDHLHGIVPRLGKYSGCAPPLGTRRCGLPALTMPCVGGTSVS